MSDSIWVTFHGDLAAALFDMPTTEREAYATQKYTELSTSHPELSGQCERAIRAWQRGPDNAPVMYTPSPPADEDDPIPF